MLKQGGFFTLDINWKAFSDTSPEKISGIWLFSTEIRVDKAFRKVKFSSKYLIDTAHSNKQDIFLL